MIVIWQCPSGTEFGDNIVPFNFFFSSFGFQEDFRTDAKEVYRISVHQCEHFVGTSPTKNAHKIFKNFGKVLCPNISKNIFSILGQKTMQINVFWSQGYGKIVFFDQKPILKIFNFWTFFRFFFQIFSSFYTFFANFYNLQRLLTHLELYRACLYRPCLTLLVEEIRCIKNQQKFIFLKQFFSNNSFLSHF